MRMDVSKGITASQALEELSVDDLSYIFKVYGEERFAKNRITYKGLHSTKW